MQNSDAPIFHSREETMNKILIPILTPIFLTITFSINSGQLAVDIEKFEPIEHSQFTVRDNLESIETETMTMDLKMNNTSFMDRLDRWSIQFPNSRHIRSNDVSFTKYVYVSNDEDAGGGPFVFNSYGDRRSVEMGAFVLFGETQSNFRFRMNTLTCPEFFGTLFKTIDPVSGNPLAPVLNGCSPDYTYFGNPSTLERPPIKFPPDGYDELKTEALSGNGYIFDSTELLMHSNVHRDTLIMTDIEFLPESGFRVKRWWFLKPPHLNELAGFQGFEIPYASSIYLDGISDPDSQCVSQFDLRTCTPYIEAMANYHAKNVINGDDLYMDPTINGPHGFTHYDYPDTSDYILTDEIYEDSGPTIIYVMGGPVRVHGTYQGQYTIVTDEYLPYHRHAWPQNFASPIDTLWCNIWITDDIRNADAPLGNQIPPQPEGQCEGGSDNRMGLVSGANVIVANTLANGAANSSDHDVVIHAAILALNESFTVQYWQNTTQTEFDPPHGDNRGPTIFGFHMPDERGVIYLWGQLIQKHHGYVIRNSPGPYFSSIGYPNKEYHFDENLACSPPPYFPSTRFIGENGDTVNLGDISQDGLVDVLDFVIIVSIILDEYTPTSIEFALGDLVPSGQIDIGDIIRLFSWVLEGRLMNVISPVDTQLIMNENSVSIVANGDVAGIQLDYHGNLSNIDSQLPDGWFIEYNDYRMIIISADGSSLENDELFQFEGNFIIESFKIVDWSGHTTSGTMPHLPTQFILHPAYPNPFNPMTTISYDLPVDSPITISIYNLQGRLVQELVNEQKSAGAYEIVWDASSQSSGVYIVKMIAGEFVYTQKIVLIK